MCTSIYHFTNKCLLLMFAGTFYVQLEDDILAKPSYISEMKKVAIEKIARKEPWFVLDFCQLGFIGRILNNLLFLSISHSNKYMGKWKSLRSTGFLRAICNFLQFKLSQ